MRLNDNLLQQRPAVKRPRRTLADLWGDICDLVWPVNPRGFEPPPPDLTLLFERQARAANIPEPMIRAVIGFYGIAPRLTIEQLHQLALWGVDQFEQGLRVGEGAKRQQQGE